MNLSPELLMHGYSIGIFPMAASRDDPEVFWVDPRRRGILPLDSFHISRSLARRIRGGGFRVAVNEDFAGVVDGCADRSDTWINAEIRAIYVELFHRGHAHSLEIWQDGELAGGVYGVTLGGAFFGESMFSRRTDASKLALAFLVCHLRGTGFTLFDTQFLTEHLASLGAIEISRADYHRRLERAMKLRSNFLSRDLPTTQEVIQRRTQTS